MHESKNIIVNATTTTDNGTVEISENRFSIALTLKNAKHSAVIATKAKIVNTTLVIVFFLLFRNEKSILSFNCIITSGFK